MFISGKCSPNRFGNKYYIRINDIQYLQTVKEKNVEKITITIDSDLLDDVAITDLSTILMENPGNTQLFIQIRDTETMRPITLRSRNCSIDVKRNLISFLHATAGMSFKIN